MTAPTIILILWSVMCLGIVLAATDKPGALTYVLPNIGFGLILWSIGISVWMIGGYVAGWFG